MHLGELLTDTWPDDRVVVGRHGGRLVALDRGQPLLVVGPPRAGKTTSVIVPAVAHWGGSVVATSIRSDVLDVTYAQRAGRGDVLVFDPTGTLGYDRPGHLDFVRPCTDQDVARRTANTIVSYMRYEGVRDGEFWRTSAARLLTVLLFAAAHGGHPVGSITGWLVGPLSVDVHEVLERTGNEAAVRTYEDFHCGPDTYVGSVRATAAAALQTYEDSRVARSVRAGGLDPERFLAADSGTLYLCLPPEEQRALAPYCALTVDTIVAAQHRRQRRCGPGAPPVLLALDEAMNIAPLRDLSVLASTAAGTGMQLVTVAHDFSQIVREYGEAEAHTIVANHSLLFLGGGLREHALGVVLDRLVDPAQLPAGATWTGTPSEWVRRLDPSRALLVHRDLAPVVVDLTRWFDDDAQVVAHLDALFALEGSGPDGIAADPDGEPGGPGGDRTDVTDAGPVAWPRFECGTTGVYARFPSSPRYEQPPRTHLGERHQLVHEHDGISVALDVTEIRDPCRAPGTTGATLENVAEGIATELRADVVAREPVLLGEYDALDVALRGGNRHTHLRVTMAGTCLVAAQVQASRPAHDVFSEFISTLEIRPPSAVVTPALHARIDGSARLTIPTPLRPADGAPLVMSLWYGGIRVWSPAAFDARCAGFRTLPEDESPSRRAMIGFLASSAPTRLDDRGRLYVPDRFRQSCGMGSDVVVQPTDDGFTLTPLDGR